MTRTAYILPLLLLFLAGCAGVAPPEPTPPAETPAETRERAREVFARGDFVEAARLYRRLAEAAKPPERNELWLRAATARTRAGQVAEAEADLSHLDTATLSAEGRMRVQLLQAELALLQHRPERALERLAAPEAPGVEPALQAEYHNLRARAHSQLETPMEAARERVLREDYLEDPLEIEANRDAIWQSLSDVEPEVLKRRAGELRDTLGGWLSLARLAQILPRDPGATARKLAEWRRDYPDHPAAERFLERLQEKAREMGARPTQIALLLPLSGRFQEAGKAVRDGFMAGYFADAERASRVRIYDTGEDPTAVDGVYDRALAEGAEFVIGPLRKPAVRSLAGRDELPVPTLCLNDAAGGVTPINLYQFDLSPEGEARQVAEGAWEQGHRHALVYVPKGDWGGRVRGAFRERWEELGGQVVATQEYDRSVSDFSGTIKHLLNLDQSEARHRRLARTIGLAPKFEPRRRQDADLIFLGAFARQARLIRPQLKFHRAADLPVYATSHVFTGNTDAARDQDMAAIRFVAMPWSVDAPTPSQSLRRNAAPYLAAHADRWQRLAALGVDAYALTTRLRTLSQYPGRRFLGETGLLRVDDDSRVRRRLPWVRFENGEPKLLEMPDAQGGRGDEREAGAEPAR